MKVQIFMLSNIYVNMSEFSEYHIARAHDKKMWQTVSTDQYNYQTLEMTKVN